MSQFYMIATVILFTSIHQLNGLKCYNCHTKCIESAEDKLNCEYTRIYMNTITYNPSRDGYECPSNNAELNDPKFIENCEENSFCGKREISIQVRLSGEEKEPQSATEYPILNTKRIYHRVMGCMKPKIDCDKNIFNKVIRNKSITDKNETITITGKIVEEADCRKCQQDLCNADDNRPRPTQEDTPNLANKNVDSILFLLFSALLFNTVTK